MSKGIGIDRIYGKLLMDKRTKSNFILQIVEMCNSCKFPEYLSTGNLILLSKTDSNFPEINSI